MRSRRGRARGGGKSSLSQRLGKGTGAAPSNRSRQRRTGAANRKPKTTSFCMYNKVLVVARSRTPADHKLNYRRCRLP